MLNREKKSGSLLSAVRSVQLAAALLSVVLLTGCAQSAVAQQGASVAALPAGGNSDYRLGSGDHLRITVFGEQDLSGEYQVDGSGKMAFPLLGQVQAGGMTAGELQNQLSHALSPAYIKNPAVSVEVLTYRPFYIVGEVQKPGSYPYVSGMTVINAVALAGGFTYRAKENRFELTRSGPNGQKQQFDASQLTPVQPGDVITVPERFF
jgi:protein involved in polysaccharide export with SLBB domain